MPSSVILGLGLRGTDKQNLDLLTGLKVVRKIGVV
jgi:hypothetical protein